MQKNRCRMFIRRHRRTKSNVAEILQCVRQLVIRRVSGLPQTIALGEFLWDESGEAQQVVGPVFDHVDPEIVTGVDREIRTACIAEGKPSEFRRAIERRMLDAFHFGNIEQAFDYFVIVDFAVGSEDRAKLEAEYLVVSLADVAINRDLFTGRFTVQAGRLKQNRNPAEADNSVHGAAIKRDEIA